MPLWNFLHEKNNPSSGANSVAGRIAGYEPFGGATDGRESWKRNVVATKYGWVRRTNVTKDGANSQRDEIVVAANPGITSGTDDGYANVSHLAFPDIAQVYFSSNSTGGTALQANSYANIYVVFNEPIRSKGGRVIYQFKVANTVSGNATTAYWSNNSIVAGYKNGGSSIVNANNTLVFRVYLPFVNGKTSTYKVNANTVQANGVTAAGVLKGGGVTSNLVSENITTAGSEAANLVITGAVSNNAGTFTVRAAKTGG